MSSNSTKAAAILASTVARLRSSLTLEEAA